VSSLVAVSRRLARAVEGLAFEPPVAWVYNPLRYAREPHERYLERWARPGIEALLVGMNPGPWGMSQTGVPFGEVGLVREWLGITGRVRRPQREHPARPVLGFECARSEVSGARLWGWARARYGSPDAFFARFFVWNYCPLAFLEESGRNRTPDKLPAGERGPLFEACDEALRGAVRCLAPRRVVGIGAFARDRAAAALASEAREGGPSEVGMILHPSPASPAANRGWAAQAEAGLAVLGIEL